MKAQNRGLMVNLQEFIAAVLAGRDQIRVLEAGCGSAAHLDLGDRMVITGLDISRRQLERHPRLAVRIEGDLQTYPLPREAFDLVVCWDVLEHLPRPRAAVENLAGAVAPGGYLVLKVPNALAPKSLLTRLTPYRFHVWFYRRVLGHAHAGHDDIGPFPTCMKMGMRPAALRRQGRRHGLVNVHERFYESPAQVRLRRQPAVAVPWTMLRGLLRLVSAGRYDVQDTEYALVMHRTPAAQPSRL